jgi:hypothetical protein
MEPLASVGAVREELRRLGYLESGLDRFVLAGRSPSLASASLRVGLAGGVLMGPLLTLAAFRLGSGLPGDARDLLILSLYASIAFGTATGLVALVGGLLLRRRSRTLPPESLARASRGVGLGMALFGLVYLVLWVRSHAALAPVAVQAAAIAVGLLFSLLLARFGSLAAIAVLTSGGQPALPSARTLRGRLVPFLVLAASGLAGALALARFGLERDRPAPPFAVVPTGLRVVVLGIDGLEGRMADLQEMPHLRALLTLGARGRLRPEPEAVPAIVWTSVATGRGPEAHGILSTDARRLPGMRTAVSLGSGPFSAALASILDVLRISTPAPPSGLLRGAKTFWNVASEKGLRVGCVNWWATWPAEPVDGFTVSDRAFFKLEKGGAPDREVFPPDDFARIAPLAKGSGDAPARLDRFAALSAETLAKDAPPDLLVVYLPGLDIVTTQTLGAAQGDLPTLEGHLREVSAYYKTVDELLAAFPPGPDRVVIVAGDPGRYARSSPNAEGVLAIAGGPARPSSLGFVSERDLAPTVLHLLGLPRSEELDGRILTEALDPAFLAAHPVRSVRTYGSHRRGPVAETAFDKDVVEELKSLGYVQ